MKKTVFTLQDIEEGAVPLRGDANSRTGKEPDAFDNSQSHGSALFKCLNIPNLSNADHAKSLLDRVVREFTPIIQRRGYNVTSISEMCCCADGLDPHKSRKCRRMGSNVWGYNQTHRYGSGRSFHEIHVRLRRPNQHTQFLTYEEVAGTLAHELAHCVHGPHNDKFYKLMDEILEEHATLMASGLTSSGGTPMAAFSGQGKALGGSGNSRARGVPPHSRLLQQQLQGRCLGGDKTLAKALTPVEAAAAAAEARRRQEQMRLRGNHCCQPCVIEIKDDDDDDEPSDQSEKENGEKKPAARPTTASPSRQPRAAKKYKGEPVFIDLTQEATPKVCSNSKSTADWACHRCTFLNSSTAPACGMCDTKRSE